jgi:ketosteroid isomerase-like protein
MASIDWDGRLREAVAAFNAGDYDEISRYVTPDVELQRVGNAPEAIGVVSGRDAVLQFFHPDAFDEQRLEALEIEGGPPALVGHQRFHARGAGSGLPVEIESWIVYRVEGDLVRRIEVYQSREEALAAAELG